MSDHCWIIVDRDATADQHVELIAKVIDWLATEQIVEREQSKCVLGLERFGHKPGPRFMTATADQEDARADNMNYRGILTKAVNGLEIRAERMLYLDYAEVGRGVCAACGTSQEDDASWGEAAQAWMDGDVTAELICEACGASAPVAEWSYDPPMFFGTLAFHFWNWPSLGDPFVREYERLSAHRVGVISCRI